MPHNVMPVIVSHVTPIWIRIAVGSLLKNTSFTRVLVVDNSPGPENVGYRAECASERAWLRSHPGVVLIDIPNRAATTTFEHGQGLDAALNWCRGHDIDVMVHLEPDCLVLGDLWVHRLLEPLTRGAWMSGANKKPYGPIHPTPSAWRTTEVRAGFRAQPRGIDEHHPRFNELFNLNELRRCTTARKWAGFWRHYWDTGQKAWFYAAVEDRAALVEHADDFVHFWMGSPRRPDNSLAPPDDPRFTCFLG
jgi:hypothetical protein